MATFQRAQALSALQTNQFDVVVIGAGMTGTGVAVDCASRGLKVALLDSGDFASGTSSKSSKMVHGGLRYLQQKEFRLVYENLRERQRLLENAPYLVRPLPFLIPLFGKDGVVSKTVTKAYATALRLYDITGGWRIGQRYRQIDKAEALRHLPTLKADALVSGFIYLDARGDDARVALTLARTAVDHGAVAANYVRVAAVERNERGQVNAVLCHDEITGTDFTVRTSTIVNASGVWADAIFSMAENEESHRITPAKGVHISVPASKLPADVAAVFNVPGDRRSIFVVPFEDAPYTFVGTTDTAYDGDLDTPDCNEDDVAYLLKAVNNSTSSNIGVADITGVWAGLRPLLAPQGGKELSERTADLSRRHQVTDSKDGVVHITGGKWTTYRQMAEDTVDALGHYFPKLGKVKTKNLRLHGVSKWVPETPLAKQLYMRFGDDARIILTLIGTDPTLGEPVIEGQSYIAGEFVFCAQEEMATSLIDLLTRRTRAHLHDARATLASTEKVARLVAPHLKWDESRISKEIASYQQLVAREFKAAGLPL